MLGNNIMLISSPPLIFFRNGLYLHHVTRVGMLGVDLWVCMVLQIEAILEESERWLRIYCSGALAF